MLTSTDYINAEQNGIKAETLKSRYYKGWDAEKAVNESLRSTERREWAKVAERNGISKGTFDGHVYAYGWGFERAATESIHKTHGRSNRETS
jgi:hypothetical protein